MYENKYIENFLKAVDKIKITCYNKLSNEREEDNMITAQELLELRMDADEKRKIAEAKAKELNNELEKETIRYCDEVIGKKLEEYAKENKSIKYITDGFIEKDCLGREHFHTIETNYNWDGTGFSYTGPVVMFDLLSEYLEKHGYKTVGYPTKVYTQAIGYKDGVKYEITIDHKQTKW